MALQARKATGAFEKRASDWAGSLEPQKSYKKLQNKYDRKINPLSFDKTSAISESSHLKYVIYFNRFLKFVALLLFLATLVSLADN